VKNDVNDVWFMDRYPCIVIKGEYVYTYTDEGVYGIHIREVSDFIERSGVIIE